MFYWLFDRLKARFAVPKPTPQSAYVPSREDTNRAIRGEEQRQQLVARDEEIQQRADQLHARIQVFTQRGT